MVFICGHLGCRKLCKKKRDLIRHETKVPHYCREPLGCTYGKHLKRMTDFVCDQCHQPYSTKQRLLSHVKAKHSIIPQPAIENNYEEAQTVLNSMLNDIQKEQLSKLIPSLDSTNISEITKILETNKEIHSIGDPDNEKNAMVVGSIQLWKLPKC